MVKMSSCKNQRIKKIIKEPHCPSILSNNSILSILKYQVFFKTAINKTERKGILEVLLNILHKS